MFQAIGRRKWLFFIVASLSLLGLASYVLHMTPMYQATALVDVSSMPNMLSADTRSRGENASDPILIRTEVEVLGSDQIARRVIQLLNLDQKAGVAQNGLLQKARRILEDLGIAALKPASDPQTPSAQIDVLVRDYHSSVTIGNDGRSTIASINVLSPDPVLASKIANANARIYLSNRLERKLEGVDVLDVKLVSPAGVPSVAAVPKTGFLLIVSCLVSVIAGAMVALTVDLMLRRSDDVYKIAPLFGLEPITSIPLPRKGRSENVMFNAIFKDRVRELCSRVLREPSSQCSVVLISSSLPREGKSLICLALAESIASHSHSTLLIDADLRKPSLADATKSNEGAPGLEAVLRKEANYQDARRAGKFDLLPSFRSENPPIDALVGDVMKSILDQVRQHYRFVIIDTPPLAAVSDACALAGLAEHTLFVSDGSQASLKLMQNSLDKLRTGHAKLAGLIYTTRKLHDLGLHPHRSLSAYRTQ